MTRPIPIPVLAWQAPNVKRPYRRPVDCYYQIAKALVLKKYGIDGPIGGDDPSDEAGTVAELDADYLGLPRPAHSEVQRRLRKKHILFYSNADRYNPDPESYSGTSFDERLWRNFVIRVAKFLAFVDRTRGARGMLETLSNEQLQSEFDSAERDAGVFMDRASAIKAEIERRKR